MKSDKEEAFADLHYKRGIEKGVKIANGLLSFKVSEILGEIIEDVSEEADNAAKRYTQIVCQVCGGAP